MFYTEKHSINAESPSKSDTIRHNLISDTLTLDRTFADLVYPVTITKLANLAILTDLIDFSNLAKVKNPINPAGPTNPTNPTVPTKLFNICFENKKLLPLNPHIYRFRLSTSSLHCYPIQ